MSDMVPEVLNAALDSLFTPKEPGEQEYQGEDGLLYCRNCHTPVQCRVKLWGRDKIVPCLCRCQQEAMAEKKRQDELVERQRKIRQLKATGIQEKHLLEWNFAVAEDNKDIQMAKRYVEQWKKVKAENLGLLLWGDVGTGKSFVAACIANALLDQGIPVLMTNFSKILNQMGAMYSEERYRYIASFSNYSLLILDDLGIERSTEYALEQVYAVIDERYKSGLPVIITTNLKIAEIRNPQDPGYDEYRYNLEEIGHNPYELASLLTVEFENYTRSQVQARLQSIFEAQYELKLVEKVEIRTRKETRVGYRYNPITGTGHTYTYQVTVQYEYKILNVTLLNRGVDYVARNSGLTDDQLQRYEVTLECRGNRDDLFAGIAFATPDGVGSSGEYQDYDIPGEALTDEKFRKMITEAEKYLGYPYVWGGSSPSTSFDCSGFVSWVINHCGNGWNVGRQTANGLMGKCDIIPKSEAKPGDLIFFQKTYNTSGASHVGIYVGNGMMIHCGNPISYASIETNYWRQHYYCMGRIR